MSSTEREPLLVAERLQKSFGATPALADAGMRLWAGEVLAVMGPSGSGKSTLLHCAAGIITPDQGNVRYQGQDLTDMSDEQRSALRRSAFGFVFQFGQLVPELSCVDNVALPLRLDHSARRVATTRAREWLERLGVAEVGHHRPGQLAGGQAQRVAVARALVTNPRVIFADEPTGSLDSLNSEQVMRLLTGAARDTEAAVVLVTHEPRVAAYSDREITVRDGYVRSLEPAL